MEREKDFNTIIKYIAKFNIEKNTGKIPYCSDDTKFLVIRPVTDIFIAMDVKNYLPKPPFLKKRRSINYACSFEEADSYVSLKNLDFDLQSYLEQFTCFHAKENKLYLLPVTDNCKYSFIPGTIKEYGVIDLELVKNLLRSEERFNYEYPGF